MSVLLTTLFQISSLFGDFELVLKVAGMLFIYSFVKQHLPDRPVLSTVLILGLCAFLLFDVWKIFGSALILYLIVLFGFSHILVDLSFMHAFGEPAGHGGGQHKAGGDLKHQAAKMLFGKRGGRGHH